MRNFHFEHFITTASLAAALAVGAGGCSNLPGTHGEQGAAIGGVGGAVAGAAVDGEHHRLLGALIGAAAGAGGGYLIGANSDRITGHDTTGAEDAVRRAQQNPATPAEAMSAPTADLNGDGFVTMDEVVAMKQAGLSDQQMLQKLQASGQVFELTPQQQDYLRQNGVDQYLIDQLPQINRDVRDRLMAQPSQPALSPAYPYAPAGIAPGYAPSPNAPVPPPPGP